MNQDSFNTMVYEVVQNYISARRMAEVRKDFKRDINRLVLDCFDLAERWGGVDCDPVKTALSFYREYASWHKAKEHLFDFVRATMYEKDGFWHYRVTDGEKTIKTAKTSISKRKYTHVAMLHSEKEGLYIGRFSSNYEHARKCVVQNAYEGVRSGTVIKIIQVSEDQELQ